MGGEPLPSEPPSSAGSGWALKSSSCKTFRSLLGIAGKRENSFIEAVNEMSFAIRFHRCHVADPQHPRLAQGGSLWRGLWEGGHRHRNIKTRQPLPQSSPVAR